MITRAQMPRQLRNKGGITNAVPREKYGLGSKIKERFRKLIPNELADVAVAAAPFVAPFNPGIAGLMRGIGRFDQRGSISDALKQGAATFGLGAGARALGGADPFGGGLRGGFTSPLDTEKTTKFKKLFDRQKANEDFFKKKDKPGFLRGAAEETIGRVPVLKNLSPKVQEKLLAGTITSGASALYSYFTGEFEPQEPGETLGEYMARRKERVKSQMRQVIDSYYTPLRNPSYAAMSDEEKDNFIDGIVGQTELEGTTDYQGMATGGRVGYQTGGITMANTLAENIRRNLANQAAINERLQQARTRLEQQLPGRNPQQFQIEREANRIAAENLNQMTGGARGVAANITGAPTINDIQAAIAANRNVNRIQTGPQPGELDPLGIPMSMTSLVPIDLKNIDQKGMPRKITQDDIDTYNFTRNKVLEAQAAMKPTYQEALMGESWETLSDNDQYRLAMEYPGETPPRRNPNFVPGLAKGGMPVGIMRSNKAGVMERDYRETGGFVPVGIKEKADDVPAMLSKNEFVFTADAVRGAGNGSIEKGAQRMYNTMKNLEKRVV